MSSLITFESQLVMIFEGFANSAVEQIIKLVNNGALALREENNALRRSLVLMERDLKAARSDGLTESTQHTSVEVAVRGRSTVFDREDGDFCNVDQRPTTNKPRISCGNVDSAALPLVMVKDVCIKTAELSPCSLPHKDNPFRLPSEGKSLLNDSVKNVLPARSSHVEEGCAFQSELEDGGFSKKSEGIGDIQVVKHETQPIQEGASQLQENGDSGNLLPAPCPLLPLNQVTTDYSQPPLCSFKKSPEWTACDGGSDASNVDSMALINLDSLQSTSCGMTVFSDTANPNAFEQSHSLPDLATLRMHRYSHAPSKPRARPFRCMQCGKAFTAKSSLKTHLLIHTGEKPFSCGVCGRRFSLLCNLKTHERLHRGERPYRCQRCGRSFTQNHVLKKHVCI